MSTVTRAGLGAYGLGVQRQGGLETFFALRRVPGLPSGVPAHVAPFLAVMSFACVDGSGREHEGEEKIVKSSIVLWLPAHAAALSTAGSQLRDGRPSR